jgi:hypothetical protein
MFGFGLRVGWVMPGGGDAYDQEVCLLFVGYCQGAQSMHVPSWLVTGSNKVTSINKGRQFCVGNSSNEFAEAPRAQTSSH